MDILTNVMMINQLKSKLFLKYSTCVEMFWKSTNTPGGNPFSETPRGGCSNAKILTKNDEVAVFHNFDHLKYAEYL